MSDTNNDSAATQTPETAGKTGDPVKTSVLSAVLGIVKPTDDSSKARVHGTPEPMRPTYRGDDDDEESFETPESRMLKAIEAEEGKNSEAAEEGGSPDGGDAGDTPHKKDVSDEGKPGDEADQKKQAAPVKVTRKDPKSSAKEIAEEIRKHLNPSDAPAKSEYENSGKTEKTSDAGDQSDKDKKTPSFSDEELQDLSPEEREELDLVIYAESKDSSRKGLSTKFVEFYKKQRDFLESAASAASDEGEEYDPERDPNYRTWLAKNQPTFSRADRKKFYTEQITEEAERKALAKAREDLNPQIEELKRKTLELEHSPRIDSRVDSYVAEVTSELPEEMVSFFKENGNDFEKTKDAFPVEFQASMSTLRGATNLAKEFLRVKRGLSKFDPENVGTHAYLQQFVEREASEFVRSGGDDLVRDGREFVHPKEWKPELSKTHWTFDEEDVLSRLRQAAGVEVRSKIKAEHDRLEKMGYSRVRRDVKPGDAPSGSDGGDKITAEPEEERSPRSAQSPMGGASTAHTQQTPRSPVLDVLRKSRRTG